MARYAVIEDGRVINAVEADEAFAAEQGWVGLTGHAGIGWLWDGEAFSASTTGADQLVALKVSLGDQIDARVAEVYSRWLRFEAEYVAREAAARKFIADGTSSQWVLGFAQPAGLTEAEAASLIVQQADNLRTALGSLGALRMRKYEVKAAASESAARAVATEILAAVDTIAAGL